MNTLNAALFIGAILACLYLDQTAFAIFFAIVFFLALAS